MRAALSVFLFTLLACGPSQPDMPTTASSAEPPTATDTALAYRTAVHDYIQAVAQGEAPVPDTLFVGRHPDFQAITLPDTIDHRVIRIVAPAEAEHFSRSPHFAYLNLFAWFAPGKVEFMIVRFEQGMRHRPDGRDDRQLYYTTVIGPEQFLLDSIR